MTAPISPRATGAHDLNLLHRGVTYRIATRHGVTTGEYLGIETPHGQRAILLRNTCGTASIPLDDVQSLRPTSA
jgi:hypothetical protein